MKRPIILLSFLFLTACAGPSINNPVGKKQLDPVRASWFSVLAVGDGYRDLCEQKVINKSCWNVIAKLQPYEAKAEGAYQALRLFVKNNPTLDASMLVNAVTKAIQYYKDVQIQYGVK